MSPGFRVPGQPGRCTSVVPRSWPRGPGAYLILPIPHPRSPVSRHARHSPVNCTIVHNVSLKFLGQTVQSAILSIRPNACDLVLNTDLGCRIVAPCFQRCQAVESRTRSLVQASSTCYLGRAGLQSGNVRLVAKPSGRQRASAKQMRARNARLRVLCGQRPR